MIRVARVGLHHFEEPCISGENGSGTIFFTGCNLRCKFCQNYDISHTNKGIDVTEDELFRLMKHLKAVGAHNINLVTPYIWTDRILPVLKRAKEEIGLPIVWNSSGYETVENLKKLEGIVDIYLPDFKYSQDKLGEEYSGIKNYSDTAFRAISEMRRQHPQDIFDENGMMKEGVIVRHLILPDAVLNTKGVLKKISEIDSNLYVSLMGQYFPTENVTDHPSLKRRITKKEYDECTDYFFKTGLKNGFSQELSSATEEYVPSFDLNILKQILENSKNLDIEF
ncbi:MAG: radical SAM protein [Clostridia bacterium]|nr:radical SAM protein [Clostridia bacterium]